MAVSTIAYNPEEFILQLIYQFWESGLDNPRSPLQDGRRPHLTHDWEGDDRQIPSIEIYNDYEKHKGINLNADVYREEHGVRIVTRMGERHDAWKIGKFLIELCKEFTINHHLVEGFEDNDFGRLEPMSMNRVVEYSEDVGYWRHDIVVTIERTKVYYRR